MGTVGCTCYYEPFTEKEVISEGALPILPQEAREDGGDRHPLSQHQKMVDGTHSARNVICTAAESVPSPRNPAAEKASSARSPTNMLEKPLSKRISESTTLCSTLRDTNQRLKMALRNEVKPEAPFRAVPFEALKNHGKLPRSSDNLAKTLAEIEGACKSTKKNIKVVFLSHRWLRPWSTKEECERKGGTWVDGLPHPDNEEGAKFTLVIDGIEHVARVKEWDTRNVAVWLDYACIEQDNIQLRNAGVQSLLGYMTRCEFVIIPTLVQPDHLTVHRLPGDYGIRAWTRLESLCFYVMSLLDKEAGRDRPELWYSAPQNVEKLDYVLLPYAMPSRGALFTEDDRKTVAKQENALLHALHESAMVAAIDLRGLECKVTVSDYAATIGPAMVAAGGIRHPQGKDCLKELLENNVNPDAADCQGCTALWSSSFQGYADNVKKLLDARANPDVVAKSGLGPIHNAARNGHLEIVKLLLNAKAKLELESNEGMTPLMWALQGPDRKDKPHVQSKQQWQEQENTLKDIVKAFMDGGCSLPLVVMARVCGQELQKVYADAHNALILYHAEETAEADGKAYAKVRSLPGWASSAEEFKRRPLRIATEELDLSKEAELAVLEVKMQEALEAIDNQLEIFEQEGLDYVEILQRQERDLEEFRQEREHFLARKRNSEDHDYYDIGTIVRVQRIEQAGGRQFLGKKKYRCTVIEVGAAGQRIKVRYDPRGNRWTRSPGDHLDPEFPDEWLQKGPDWRRISLEEPMHPVEAAVDRAKRSLPAGLRPQPMAPDRTFSNLGGYTPGSSATAEAHPGPGGGVGESTRRALAGQLGEMGRMRELDGIQESKTD